MHAVGLGARLSVFACVDSLERVCVCVGARAGEYAIEIHDGARLGAVLAAMTLTVGPAAPAGQTCVVSATVGGAGPALLRCYEALPPCAAQCAEYGRRGCNLARRKRPSVLRPVPRCTRVTAGAPRRARVRRCGRRGT